MQSFHHLSFLFSLFSAEGVYFVRRKPKEDGEKEKENEIDILFHLSFKSSKEISLMTYEGITMKKEVIMTYDNVDEKLCGKPFELVIRLLRDEPEIPLVFINEEFLTAYESKNDITCTEYIGFTSGLRVCASEIKR